MSDLIAATLMAFRHDGDDAFAGEHVLVEVVDFQKNGEHRTRLQYFEAGQQTRVYLNRPCQSSSPRAYKMCGMNKI
jgi:hypothetical protein